jgi:hypothetical protein
MPVFPGSYVVVVGEQGHFPDVAEKNPGVKLPVKNPSRHTLQRHDTQMAIFNNILSSDPIESSSISLEGLEAPTPGQRIRREVTESSLGGNRG